MSEQRFSNREIVAMSKEIIDTLDRIETQTIKTNGRVTALEIASSKQSGVFTVMKYVLGMAIVTLLSYLAWIGMQITDIHTTLSQYDVTIEK